MSELLPHLHGVADDLCIVRTVATNVFNHGPAKLFRQHWFATIHGTTRHGGLVDVWPNGSRCQDLPGFVVLQSGPRGPRGGSPLWGSGFLPTTYQGVPFRTGKDPILNLLDIRRE